jgi:hypothetical protein
MRREGLRLRLGRAEKIAPSNPAIGSHGGQQFFTREEGAARNTDWLQRSLGFLMEPFLCKGIQHSFLKLEWCPARLHPIDLLSWEVEET